MKWMGGWGYEDLQAAPPDYIAEIVAMIEEESQE